MPLAHEIIYNVARNHGLGVRDILGGGRTKEVVKARHSAIKAVKAAKPHLSSTVIGRIFGRDHTSILWALGTLAKCEQRRAAR
jgi:chromosomal replication initiation ATPase DnaA